MPDSTWSGLCRGRCDRTQNERRREISLQLNLDGSGRRIVSTGVGFLDHMLELLHAFRDRPDRPRPGRPARRSTSHGGGCRHLFGQAIREALGDKSGISPLRAFHAAHGGDARHDGDRLERSLLPGLPGRLSDGQDRRLRQRIGGRLLAGVAANALCNLHVVLHHGRNSHHISEAIFKAAARALRMAVETDPAHGRTCPAPKGTCRKGFERVSWVRFE